jgi:hypothetical protein
VIAAGIGVFLNREAPQPATSAEQITFPELIELDEPVKVVPSKINDDSDTSSDAAESTSLAFVPPIFG